MSSLQITQIDVYEVNLPHKGGTYELSGDRLIKEGLVKGMGGPEALQQAVKAANEARLTEGKGQEVPVNPALSPSLDAIPPEYPPIVKDLASYYLTSRGRNERAPGLFAARSADLLANFDAYAYNSLISPRPLLMIAGAEAGTRFFSEDGVAAAKDPKEAFINSGRTHADLYDNTTESGPKLVAFFKKNL
ncbi:uncharacterized protein BDV17DRAFT_292913 [Aspergillus undulatus]|uniref:uncharacterized protein n=1 Tax=Aspergillus undulatus TaxID=1810928 RepID=UPI003CCD249D